MKPATPYRRGTRQMAIHRTRDEFIPKEMVENILTIYHLATDEEKIAGLAWYCSAHVEAERIGGTVQKGAGIIAALSPQNSWAQNLLDAWALTIGEPTTQVDNAVAKASAILAGVDPLDVLGGRKTRAFYRNILEPNRYGPVTVDRHAITLALLGEPAPERLRLAVARRLLKKIGAYQVVAGTYRSAARLEHLLPQEIQATTWLTWRRINKIGWAKYDPF